MTVSVITACVVVLILFIALSRIKRAREESEIADAIVISAFERSTFRADYLRNGTERAKKQWFAKHEQMGRLLSSAAEEFRDPEDKKIINEMIKDQASTEKLFSRIVENREKADHAGFARDIEDRLANQLEMRLYGKVLNARSLRESAGRHLSSALQFAGWGIIWVVAMVAAGAMINSVSLVKTITNRVLRLRSGAAIIGEGNLDYRLEMKGDDEFGELARSFNAMTAKLQRSRAELEKEIGERRRTEEALRESHERLKKVLEVQTVGVMFWDLNTGCMTDANDTFLSLMGYSRSEVEAGKLTWQKLTPPEYMDVSRAEVQKFLATGRVGPYEKEYLHKDGTRQWFVFAGSSLGNNTCVEFCVDISARKKAEEALRESEERFRVAQELSPDGFLIFRPLRDTAGAVTDFLWIYENDAAARMNDTDPEQVRGKRVSEVLPHHEESPFHKAYKEVAETGEVRVLEEAFYDQDTFRQRRWFRVAAVPTTRGDVAVLVQNVTERKRAEEELNRIATQNKLILESAGDGIWGVDTAGVVTFINHAGTALLGYDAGELIGQPSHVKWHHKRPDGTPYPASECPIYAAYKDGKAHAGEEMFWKKDGSAVPVDFTSRPMIENGRITGAVVTFKDIAERKRAEEMQGHLSAIVESAEDAIISENLNGVIQTWNIGAERLFGYAANEAIGENISFLVPPGHPDEVPDILRRIRQGEHIEHFETVRTRKDGATVPVSLIFSPIRDAEGRIVGASKIAHDISERILAEKERERLIAELKRSNSELEQFAYVASHDLQEPLRMVGSYTTLLKKKYEEKLDEKAQEYIDFAVDGALRMQKLIEGLLAYSRITRQGAEFVQVDLNSVFAIALANLSVTITETNAEVTKDDLPLVWGDETQLVQLFQNLIGNGVKYRESDVAPKVHVSGKKDGQSFVFSVRDNGIGIEPKYYERIFQIFQRLHATSRYAGTGIGLALCKRIVERHHGRIWVESAPGKGSTFFFSMPVSAAGVRKAA